MNGRNKADMVLLMAFFAFLLTLFLRLQYAGNIFFRFLHFCAEAALIGGIADWFAVTALFKKPLGISYHTAILPRRREQFTLACVRMVQAEFFSKRRIFMRIKRMNFLHLTLNWLDTAERKNILTGWVLQYIEKLAWQADLSAYAKTWETEIKNTLKNVPQDAIYQKLEQLAKSDKVQDWLTSLLAFSRSRMEGEAGREKILQVLEDFRKEKVQGSSLASLFSIFAEMSNMVNFEESAIVLQDRILCLLEELEKPESAERKILLEAVGTSLQHMAQDEDWRNFADQWREHLVDIASFQTMLQNCMKNILQRILRRDTAEGTQLGEPSVLALLVQQEIEKGIEVLKQDTAIQKNVDRFLYDLIGRTVLKAQPMLGEIATNALREMTDEQINRLVYGKVEADLLWIRMNGSIVGAIVGGVLFVLMQVV